MGFLLKHTYLLRASVLAPSKNVTSETDIHKQKQYSTTGRMVDLHFFVTISLEIKVDLY